MMRAMDDPPASLAITLGNVGLRRYNRGDLDDARRHFEEALAVYDSKDREFFERAYTLLNLALIESDEQRHDQATALVEEAGRVIFETLGEEHQFAGMYHYRMAQTRFRAGDYVGGEAHGRRATTILRAAGVGDSPDMARVIAAHALNLAHTGRAIEAERRVRDALAVRRRANLPGDWRIGELNNALAVALEQQGRLDEVGPVLEEAYRYYREGSGANHPRTTETARRAAAYFERVGDAERAARYRGLARGEG
jgi:tetratricopeptide (TPR) repeat protein